MFLIRGENVVLIGLMDENASMEGYEKGDYHVLKQEDDRMKADRAAKRNKDLKVLERCGFSVDFVEDDNY